jgi:enoyl-CoA hydratase
MPEPSAAPDVADIRDELDGTLGRIVLDRPKTLNALTLPMVVRLEQILDDWRDRPLSAVVIESSDKRAFCAGGDIHGIRQNTLDGRPGDSELFFATEYRVNATLAAYPHPVVSLIDGVCMGGGIGLSVHGAFRIATEAAMFAMPETAIGFFPDVGGSYFLSRLPAAVGMYLGLTGARFDAGDALHVGLATHFCAAASLQKIPELLRTGRPQCRPGAPFGHRRSGTRRTARRPPGRDRRVLRRKKRRADQAATPEPRQRVGH